MEIETIRHWERPSCCTEIFTASSDCMSSSPQVMTPGLYYYYVTELAFYWSLVFSQFTDIKRKVRGGGGKLPGTSAATVVIILDGHMPAVPRSGGERGSPSVEALYAHPPHPPLPSCDPTGLILLELHGEVLSSPLHPPSARRRLDSSHDPPVRYTRPLKLRVCLRSLA